MNRTPAEITDRATLAAFRAGWSVVRRLPPRTAYGLFDRIADVAYRRDTRDVGRLRRNYARVRPELGEAELERLVRAGMRSYLRYWCEAFRLPDLDQAALVAAVRPVGFAAPRADLAAGRSVVAFLAHMGNWDMAGAWSTTQFGPVTTVAERLEPEELFADFLAFRTRLGMTIYPLTGGEPPFPQLVEAARAGGRVIPLVADRDLTQHGVAVTFVGHAARMAAGPAALAVATGASLYPVSVHYEPVPRADVPSGWRTVVTFHDRVPDPGAASGTSRARAAAMTQACADVFSGAIREHTQDWHMMQRVFVADLDPARAPGGSSVQGAAETGPANTSRGG